MNVKNVHKWGSIKIGNFSFPVVLHYYKNNVVLWVQILKSIKTEDEVVIAN